MAGAHLPYEYLSGEEAWHGVAPCFLPTVTLKDTRGRQPRATRMMVFAQVRIPAVLTKHVESLVISTCDYFNKSSFRFKRWPSVSRT